MKADADPLQVRVRRRIGSFDLDVAFTGPAIGVTALFGPSGAGKSQTLAAVAGAVRPDEGRIALGERVLFDGAAGLDLPMERRGIGWVFQDGRLFPHLDVVANLRYGARRAKGRDAGVRFDEAVEALGLAPLLARRPRSLSGGERQRVALGRALLSQPDLLLMDEPLAALDLSRRLEILPYLERLKTLARVPILYVTHAMAEVVRFADRLVVLEHGRVSAQGALAEVMGREDLPLLAGRADAASVLHALVQGHDTARGLSRLSVGAAELITPPLSLPPGAPVRAVVLARDVLVATVRPQGLSARNVLEAVIEAVAAPRADGVMLVRLGLVGTQGAHLLSAVTLDAVDTLGLKPGREVFAILKSVAVEGLSPGGLLADLER